MTCLKLTLMLFALAATAVGEPAPVPPSQPATAPAPAAPEKKKPLLNDPDGIRRALEAGLSVDTPDLPSRPIDAAAAGKAKQSRAKVRVEAPSRVEVEKMLEMPGSLPGQQPLVKEAAPAPVTPAPPAAGLDNTAPKEAPLKQTAPAESGLPSANAVVKP